jgi:hypothetical protein
LTARTLFAKADELGIPMSLEEAKSVIKMINLECGTSELSSEITYEAFINAMKR